MEKWIETTGRTEEDAISAALFQLGLQRDDVSVEVVERAKSGFLGFGSNPAKVRVHYEDDNGTPRPLRDPFEEDLFSAVKGQPGEREPAQAPVAEKKEEAPRAEEAAVREEAPKEAAPVEEETHTASTIFGDLPEEEIQESVNIGFSSHREDKEQEDDGEKRCRIIDDIKSQKAQIIKDILDEIFGPDGER